MSERERFEAWASSRHMNLLRDATGGNTYHAPGVEVAYLAWQAGHAAALARADAVPVIHAQHDETGRMWTGPRDKLPPRYAECAAPPSPAADGLREWPTDLQIKTAFDIVSKDKRVDTHLSLVVACFDLLRPEYRAILAQAGAKEGES